MEYIALIVLIIFATIYFIAQDSKKDTTKERYGEAIGSLAQMTANSISNIAHDIVEPASKKQIRFAKEALARRHGALYRMLTNFCYDKDKVEELLTVDDSFKSSLDDLGLSAYRWKKIALHIFYIGVIRTLSREYSDYTKKNSEHTRHCFINEDWRTDVLNEQGKILKEALVYFDIPNEEWIKYGDTVIEMHNINENNDVKEYGYISQIMPMQNNLHLL